MSTGPLQSQSMSAFTCSWPAVSHHLLLCGQVSRLRSCNSQSPPVLNSVSAIASIFDRMCGEFTFSWNWFWITKARYKVVQQEASLHQDSVESKQPHVMHSSAVMVQRETFAPGAKKLWLLPWDHVFCYFRGGLYSTHSNIYIYFVYLFFLLKQLCKPPNFFKWYYKVHTAGLIVINTDRQCVSTCDVR